MFLFLARLRTTFLSFLIFVPLALSREESLFTSSVTYCQPPETLLIQQFDIAYFAKNQSISFNISAASVQPNINVTANLLLNVYGLHPVNITLDLCNILGGALCPLPMYNFTGSDSISLPGSLGVQDKIPSIAFKIPDLEGVAQLLLTEVGTGDVKACVQATLSNGWSAHQTAVEWATGGIALAALLPSIWQSLNPEATLPFRLIDLILLYQTIASTSFLSLNYPSVYRAFTLNFAWAIGLFAASPTSSLQPSIDRMRHLTGGQLANATSASPVGLVNRKLSPYNFLGNGAFSKEPSPLARRMDDVPSVSSYSAKVFSYPIRPIQVLSSVALQSATQGRDVQTVTATSSNVLEAGVPIYVNSLHIATANAFMTIFLRSLILVACMFGVLCLVVLSAHFFYRRQQQDKAKFKRTFPLFLQAWGLHLVFVLFLPILIFSFYQWTLKDSWLAVLLSVIAFLALLIAVSYPACIVLRDFRRNDREALYQDKERLVPNGPLYAKYRPARFYFFLPILVISFFKAAVIAFGKNNGEVQISLMMVLEGLSVILYIVLRPLKTRGGDIFSTFLAIVRLVCTGLTIAFVERLNVAPIPRVVIGLVSAVIFSIAIVVTFINLLINFGIDQLRNRPSGAFNSSTSGSFHASIVEKGEAALTSRSNSSEHVGRPNNPTPECSDQLDPHFLQPFPVSPTETDISTSNRTSGTMTVGSILPRRWSFSPLNSPLDSPTGSSQAHDIPSSYNLHSNTIISRHSDAPSLQHGRGNP